MELYQLYIYAFLFSFLAGLIRQLQLKKKLPEAFLGAAYAGLFGLATTLIWNKYMPEYREVLLGLCIIAALTGVSSLNKFIELLKVVSK